MIRLACVLQLGALLVLAVFLIDTTGATATAFSFVGMPLLGLSILVYVGTLLRRRYGS